jgi:hypothetical protein
MKRVLGVILATLVAVSGVAAADSTYVRESGPTYVVHKSPGYATKLSVVGTATGLVALFVGAKMGHSEGDVMKGFAGSLFVVAPSWGEWWVADRVVVTPGMVMRLAGVATSSTAYTIDHKCNAIARMTEGSSGCTNTTQNDTAMGIGLALATVGAVYDIIDASRQARNRRFVVVPNATGESTGLSVRVAF